MITNSRIVAIATIATFAAAPWAAKAADPVNVENVKTQSATVESIDLKRSSLSLRSADGRSWEVFVPPEVRHLDQVKVGDKVVARYIESVAASVRPKGSGKTAKDVDQVSRAASGTKQDAVSGHTSSTTVVIQSVDKSTYSVAFKDADGFSRNTTVKNPEVKKFVATLKAGDQVDMTYTTAWAVSLESEK